jgi:septal ring factor EnvC (AmiA/AmiB activator)
MPRPAAQVDKKQEALQAALVELQGRLQVVEDELADSRDDNTELRERNNNLMNQLEDVRGQRDTFFFDKLMVEGAEHEHE